MGKAQRNRKERKGIRDHDATNDSAPTPGFMESTFGDLWALGGTDAATMRETIEIIPVATTVREALGSVRTALVTPRPEEAIAAAEQLGEYLQGRGWVFDGKTSDLESVSWTFEPQQSPQPRGEPFGYLDKTRLTAAVSVEQVHGEYITAIWLAKPGGDNGRGPRKISREQLQQQIDTIEA